MKSGEGILKKRYFASKVRKNSKKKNILPKSFGSSEKSRTFAPA